VRRAGWDGQFLARSPWLGVLAPAAARLGRCDDWPSVDALDARLGPAAGVRFVPATPRPRGRDRRRRALDPAALYDGRIVEAGVVPTRARSWHDLLNALAWATWPRAKAALHARQHRMVKARLAPGARHLPPSRTREGDTLAMLDEGGVLLPEGAPLLFGHGLAEELVRGAPRLTARTLALAASGDDLAAVDAAFAALLRDHTRLHDPAELGRLTL
jgi:hypothetical protein